MNLTNLLTSEFFSLLFLSFFVLQRKYQLLDSSAVFCRLTFHLLLSFRPQNYRKRKNLTHTILEKKITSGIRLQRTIGRLGVIPSIIIHSKYFSDSDWLKAHA